MASSNREMKLSKQYKDNMEELADRLLTRLAEIEPAKLIDMIDESEIKYSQATWLRKRLDDFKIAKGKINAAIEKSKQKANANGELIKEESNAHYQSLRAELFEIVREFFTKAKEDWKSTSANTIFMSTLVSKLDGYNSEVPLTESEIKRLHELFLKPMSDLIYCYKMVSAQQLLKAESQVTKIKIKAEIKTYVKSYSAPERRKINYETNEDLKNTKEILNNLFKNETARRINNTQVEKLAEEFEETKAIKKFDTELMDSYIPVKKIDKKKEPISSAFSSTQLEEATHSLSKLFADPSSRRRRFEEMQERLKAAKETSAQDEVAVNKNNNRPA